MRCSSGLVRNSVACVQITLAEDFGVSDRGSFYDPVGALRDVVVNHLMQVVAVAAMEPPARRDARALKDAMFGVFSAMPKADPKQYVRGQYEGYRKIKGVAKDSKTETFAAMRFEIDNWRWTGVPFFIRTGKELPVEQWELRLIFKEPPRLGYSANSRRRPEPDQLVVRLHPTTGIRLLVDAQRSDETTPEQINLDMEFAQEGGEGPTPYEVLLHAAMVGDSTRFKRQDSIEETWRVCGPLIEKPPRVHPYKPGTWGPRPLTSSSRTTAAGTSRGPGHESREAEERRKDPLQRQGGGERRRQGAHGRQEGENAAERRDAVAVPADCGLRLHLQLPHRRTGGARRGDRLALRAAVRLAQHLRDAARPRSGLVPLRPLRDQRAEQPDLRARHQHPQHHLAHPDRLGLRPGRADDRADPDEDEVTPAHAGARGR